jgi:ATP-dependent Clp endopeptidase proteolytic subunit ClpP
MAKQHTLLIYDQIGASWWSDGVTASNFTRQLQDSLNDDDCESVMVAINSPGGSIAEGIAIYNAIVRQNAIADGKKVYTRNDGVAYSMAAIILMAGAEVSAHENTTTLLHNCSGGAFGNARDFRSSIELMEKIDKGMVKSLARKTGKADTDIEADIFNYDDHTYTAAEALELGLIDRVIEESTEAGEALQGASMAEVMAYFKKEPKAQTSFFNQLTKTLTGALQGAKPKAQSNTPKPKAEAKDEPMKIKKSFSALAAFFGLTISDEAEMVEHNPSEEQLSNLNARLAEYDQVKAKADADAQRIADLEAQVTELENDATPPSGKKGGDNTPDGGKSVDDFTSEVDAEVIAMRAELGLTETNED